MRQAVSELSIGGGQGMGWSTGLYKPFSNRFLVKLVRLFKPPVSDFKQRNSFSFKCNFSSTVKPQIEKA
ncbi:hypothetical protein BpHYR1_053056 [Brachionus plicatilis]|uniref:Uncharacterized protein n=1 Tax=Brachionus plicatilis TaxID=10195 RepID=A0A3M7T078_BRAPC|nr:hypothetical protein BpHYR1_053056 [Brachionus plicatilis]